jgi:hypothetical protein
MGCPARSLELSRVARHETRQHYLDVRRGRKIPRSARRGKADLASAVQSPAVGGRCSKSEVKQGRAALADDLGPQAQAAFLV